MNLSVDDILLGLITMLIGLFICLFSIRAIKVVMFFIGFLVGYFGCQMLLGNFDLQDNPNKETIYIVSTLVSGICVGFLILLVLHIGLFILGAVGGFFTALWLLSLLPETSELQEPVYSGLLVGFCVLFFCVVTYFFKIWVLIVCSAIIGSYVTFYGLDRFLHTGYYELSQSIFDESYEHDVDNSIMIMAMCNFLLALIGFLVQAYIHVKMNKEKKQKYNKLEVTREEEEEEEENKL